MLNIGDLVIYSANGICRVDDICDKTYSSVTRTYYVLHPIENSHQLTVSIPVENGENLLRKLMSKAEAAEILESFTSNGIDWIERPQLRNHQFHQILDNGSRMDIAGVMNTLLRKKQKAEKKNMKFNANDSKLLNHIQNILIKELAIVLNSSYDVIHDKVNRMVANSLT